MALTASQIKYLIDLLKDNLDVIELKHKETINKINKEFDSLGATLPNSAVDDVVSKKNDLIKKQDKIYKEVFDKLNKLYEALSMNGKKMADELCQIK